MNQDRCQTDLVLEPTDAMIPVAIGVAAVDRAQLPVTSAVAPVNGAQLPVTSVVADVDCAQFPLTSAIAPASCVQFSEPHVVEFVSVATVILCFAIAFA
jgi:hypothetical protein